MLSFYNRWFSCLLSLISVIHITFSCDGVKMVGELGPLRMQNIWDTLMEASRHLTVPIQVSSTRYARGYV